jgi:Na+/proline symporter/signal transduction histidine kinase
MNEFQVITATFGYILLLFAIAAFAEKNKSITDNPYIYTLSAAVYCSAWTYYGSVGSVATGGLMFLSIYIGPILVMPLWWIWGRKMIRISKAKGITTLADFISTRYGKSVSLGVMVALLTFLGLLPYLALQIKSIVQSYDVITGRDFANLHAHPVFYENIVFYISMILALFTIIFGVRNIDTSENLSGMVGAVAFESIVKLSAFMAVGVYAVYFLFGGFTDIFERAAANPDLKNNFFIAHEKITNDWLFTTVLSGLAVFLLPRQFQMMVVANQNEAHLRKAVWLFPLYLFLINIFVLPIALAGKLLLPDLDTPSDAFVLLLPMHTGNSILALFVYLGGFSAAMSMTIVAATSLSVMLGNQIISPLLLKVFQKTTITENFGLILLNLRRFLVVLIFFFAYLYYDYFAAESSLFSIGLVSFVAFAQFAPAVLGGIFWKKGNYYGAVTGILSGFAVWFYFLIVPSMFHAGIFFEKGTNLSNTEIWWLLPSKILSLTGLSSVANAFFWSMFVNNLAYFGISLLTKSSEEEKSEAIIFTDILKISEATGRDFAWKKGYIADLKMLLKNILGEEKTDEFFENFAKQNFDSEKEKNIALLAAAEKSLAAAVGSASAKALTEVIIKHEEITEETFLEVVFETQETMSLNKKLAEQADELKRLAEKLKKNDHLKNEFISTVTHELRTPLTAIKALTEIIEDNPDLTHEEREEFLRTIIFEINRMEKIINQVLELEKFESGKQVLKTCETDLNILLKNVIKTFEVQAEKEGKKISFVPDVDLPKVVADPDRMMQVFVNLLSNALKFTKEKEGRIEVISRYENGQILLIFRDNGRGVKDALKELIFEKFYQVEDQNIRKPKGSGLGLAICKQIVEYHGGKIEVSDSETGGAVFGISLTALKNN